MPILMVLKSCLRALLLFGVGCVVWDLGLQLSLLRDHRYVNFDVGCSMCVIFDVRASTRVCVLWVICYLPFHTAAAIIDDHRRCGHQRHHYRHYRHRQSTTSCISPP